VLKLILFCSSSFAGLEESRDELQAAAALQAGRELLMLNPCNNNAEKGPSLAVELLAGMNSDQVFLSNRPIYPIYENIISFHISRKFLKLFNRKYNKILSCRFNIIDIVFKYF